MAKKKQTKTGVIMTTIISLAVMQIAAMHYGVNGTFRTLVTGAICACAGIGIPQPKFLIKK